MASETNYEDLGAFDPVSPQDRPNQSKEQERRSFKIHKLKEKQKSFGDLVNSQSN